MRTRLLTGTVLGPDGQGIATGTVEAVPVGDFPASGAMGVLAPVRKSYSITAGEISGEIVAPATYLWRVFEGTRLVWQFRRAVADVAAATTLQDIYIEQAVLPDIDPDALFEGDSVLLLSAGSAAADTVLVSDGAGGMRFQSAGSGDMTKAVYDPGDTGSVVAADSVPWAGVSGTPASFTPSAHAASHAAGAADVITPAAIGAIPREAVIVPVAASRDLASTDAGCVLECDGTFTITAPNGLPAGFQAVIVNVGAGTITLAAAGTLQSKDANVDLADQYGAATMYHRGSNVWIAFGDLS